MSISVIMLSFNQDKFLESAIRSVLSQDTVDLELIIIDPGSRDKSRKIASDFAFKDPRVKLIFEKDLGPADGLNKGFRIAKNSIICYLNSDDLFLRNIFSKVERKFMRFPEIDIIYAHGIIVNQKISDKPTFAFSDVISDFTLISGAARIIQQSTFFRNSYSLVNDLKFNTANETCWDYEILVDAYLANYRFKRVNDVWGVFRIHDDSISGSGSKALQYAVDKVRIDKILKNSQSRFRVQSALIFGFPYKLIRKIMSKIIGLRFAFSGRDVW